MGPAMELRSRQIMFEHASFMPAVNVHIITGTLLAFFVAYFKYRERMFHVPIQTLVPYLDPSHTSAILIQQDLQEQ